MQRRKKHASAPGLRSTLRPLLIAAAVVCLIVVVAAGALFLLIDFDSLKPRIAAAVKQTTGRDLVVGGHISVSPGFWPTLVLENASLSGPPGAPKSNLLNVERVEIQTGIWSMLSDYKEIGQLTLIRPEFQFEIDEAGNPNWQLVPEPAQSPAGSDAPQAGPARSMRPGGRFAIRAIHVEGLRANWRNKRAGQLSVIEIPRLDATAEAAGESMLLSGKLLSGGSPLSISGEMAGPNRLLDPGATLPWQIDARAAGEGFRLAVRGSFEHVWTATSFDIRVEASSAGIAAIAPMLPDPLPQLRDGSLTAQLQRKDGGPVALRSMTVHVTDLVIPGLLPGVTIKRGEINAPGLDQAVRADVEMIAEDIPVHVIGSVGSLSSVMPGALPTDPVPVEATIDAAGSLISAKGDMRTPAQLAGMELKVVARVADLAALSPLLHRQLPAWKQIGAEAAVEGKYGPGGTLTFRNLSMGLPQGDLAGTLALKLDPRPMVRGNISARQIDLDGLLAAFQTKPAELANAAAAAAAAEADDGQSGDQAVFSSRPLDFWLLDQADVSVKLAFETMQAGGGTFGNVAGELNNKDLYMALDPIAADVSGGRIGGLIDIDRRGSEPHYVLVMHAPAVSLQALGPLIGGARTLDGKLFADVAVTANGRTQHDMAASLSGFTGVAVTDGDIGNAELTDLLGGVLKAAHLPESAIGAIGQTRLRCLGARINFSNGDAAITTLVADSPKLAMEVTGNADLGSEKLALRVRPVLHFAAGQAVVVPVKVDGSFFDPRVSPDTLLAPKINYTPAQAAPSAQVAAVPQPAVPDPCPAALALARGSMLPLPAAPPPAPAVVPQSKPSGTAPPLAH